MIIIMKLGATLEEINAVVSRVKEEGLNVQMNDGEERMVIGVIGDTSRAHDLPFASYDGVDRTVQISSTYKLTSREFHPSPTVIDVGGVKIGDGNLVVMAGPCSVESREQIIETAKIVKAGGAQFLRGGAFKPRTSPYAFQGLKEEGLKYMREAADLTGLKVITEVMDVENLPLVCKYADMLQVGARNMQNFQLLQAIGKTGMPVALKRGISGTIDEWIHAAEYIANEGNFNILFVERGIRSYEPYTRNTFDLSAVPAIKKLSHFPIMVDPSHGTGRWDMVTPMAMAGVAAGADALMVEIHPEPEKALSDGPQSLTPENYMDMMNKVTKLSAMLKEI